jgi:hypothetical protein
MLVTTACEALRQGKRLELRYDGYMRIVEVHAVGTTAKQDDVARVYQVRGGSVSNEPTGWKLLRLDDASSGSILEEQSSAPRTGYKRGDAAMLFICCQL